MPHVWQFWSLVSNLLYKIFIFLLHVKKYFSAVIAMQYLSYRVKYSLNMCFFAKDINLLFMLYVMLLLMFQILEPI